MSRFDRLPEFEKEFSKLSKRYPSLPEDLKKFERLIEANPTGVGKNFTIFYNTEVVVVIKARLACKRLKDRSIRMIYAYHKDTVTFMYIEVYFKGDKENEDRERIREYLKTIENLAK